MNERESLIGRVVIAVWLVVMWMLLWGDFNLANLVSGIGIAVALVVVFPPSRSNDDPIVVRPVAAISFLVWFVWALIVTNVAVAKEVLLPSSRSDIRPAVVAVELRTRSGRLATIVANAITLTPGTMTIEVDDPSERDEDGHVVLYVHVLGLGDAQSIRDDGLDFERLAVKAFGSSADRRRWAEAEAAASQAEAAPAADPATTEEPG